MTQLPRLLTRAIVKHSTQKKLVADRYTKSYVTKPIVADMIQQHAGVLMKKFQQQPNIDVYKWLHYYAIEWVWHDLLPKKC